QRHALLVIGGDDAGGLGVEEARKDDRRARFGDAADIGGELHQRAGEDVGDDQVVGGVALDRRVIEPGGVDLDDQMADAIDAGVFAGGVYREGIDIGGQNRQL